MMHEKIQVNSSKTHLNDGNFTQHFVEDWDVHIGDSASTKQQETE